MVDLASSLGITLDSRQHERLEDYGEWLRTEAIAAGGLGPDEASRVFERHVGDSLAFLIGVPSNATSVVDVGSGVGLPGIPLAIARPDLAVTLVDRSGRRCDLARRALRVLGLDALEVRAADVADLGEQWDVALFRASLPPERAYGVVPELVRTTGVGLLGLSRRMERPVPPQAPPDLQVDVLERRPPMLDSPFWLLRMRRTSPDHPPRES